MHFKYKKNINSAGCLVIFFISINIIAINSFAQGCSNDHIFTSASNAKPFIDFDSRGFLINGKRTFIVSAGMEYARVPRQLWFDRLLRLQRAREVEVLEY